jgi:large subunit GTPase 1
MWADHFEKQNITYAFFSAADAAAAQEQADRMWRRENDIESESEDEEEEEEVEDEHSGSEGEGESEEEEDEVEEELSKKVQETTLDSDYEEGWSTEGEDDAEEGETALDKKVANGDKIPMKDVVKEINYWEIKEEKPITEDKRTRVLSVTELENLFVNAAPELHRECFSINQGMKLMYRLCERARPLTYKIDCRTSRIPQRR